MACGHVGGLPGESQQGEKTFSRGFVDEVYFYFLNFMVTGTHLAGRWKHCIILK